MFKELREDSVGRTGWSRGRIVENERPDKDFDLEHCGAESRGRELWYTSVRKAGPTTTIRLDGTARRQAPSGTLSRYKNIIFQVGMMKEKQEANLLKV